MLITDINLELNFKDEDESRILQCIQKLHEVTDIPFGFAICDPNPRDLFTKPEYIDIVKVLKLSFTSKSDRHAFMANRQTKETYLRFSS